MKYIAQRIIYRGAMPRTQEQYNITEVTETRVRGTLPNGKTFDIKRQPGNRFNVGSGSGKHSLYLKQVEA